MRTVKRETAMAAALDLATTQGVNLGDFAASGRIASEDHRAVLLQEARAAIGNVGTLPSTLNHRAYALVRYLTRAPLAAQS
jgi:hypothetical protein